MPKVKTAYCGSEVESYDKKRFSSPSGQRLHNVESDLVFWMLRGVPAKGKVLEVGCGTGRILIEVLRAGYSVDGIDASPDMLNSLKEKLRTQQPTKAPDNIRLTVCEAADLPISDNLYDAVYSVRLLNQTESPEYALRIVDEMIRVAKPSGQVLVEFVNFFRPRWAAARRDMTRLRPAEVIKRGKEAGARVVGMRGAFFLSMQAYARCPHALLPVLDRFDRILSLCFPRLSARTYVLFEKHATSQPRS